MAGVSRPDEGLGREGALRLSGPLAPAEDRRPPAIRIHPVDVDPVRADHPVDMDHALVAAARRDLVGSELVAVDEALGVALSERDVAGGVLVEQGIEEQEAAFRDRRGMRHQGDLAKSAGAVVAVEHFLEHVLAARGLRLNDPSRLEPDRNAVDQRALIGEGLGADDMAIDPARMGGREHLFRRDVRIAGDPVLRRRRAALPRMAVGESDRQIRARPGIMQGVKFPRIQPFGPAAERRVMRSPGGDRIVVIDPRSGKDRLGEPADRDVVGFAGKDPLRPRVRSDRRQGSS